MSLDAKKKKENSSMRCCSTLAASTLIKLFVKMLTKFLILKRPFYFILFYLKREQNFVNGKWRIYRTILFFHTKSSNLINYSTDMYVSKLPPCTTVVQRGVLNSFEDCLTELVLNRKTNFCPFWKIHACHVKKFKWSSQIQL